MKRLGGWWRLWICFSVLWAVLVSVLVYLKWPSYATVGGLKSEADARLSPQTRDLLKIPPPVAGMGEWKSVPLFGVTPGEVERMVENTRRIVNGLPELPKRPPQYVREFFPTPAVEERIYLRNGEIVSLWFSPDLDEKTKKSMLNIAINDYDHAQKDILSRARLRVVVLALLSWITPAVSILLLAMGFRWVVRGFKMEPS
jgi:hypothetical protein